MTDLQWRRSRRAGLAFEPLHRVGVRVSRQMGAPQIHPPVNESWLARRREEALDPGLPIIDPHHHLWDRPGSRYLMDDALADTALGHNIRATVFVECHSSYRPSGAEAFRPVGETEFVEQIAASCDQRQPAGPRIAAGIVAYADLRLAQTPKARGHFGRLRQRG